MPAINGNKNLRNGAFFQIATLLMDIGKSYVLWLIDRYVLISDYFTIKTTKTR